MTAENVLDFPKGSDSVKHPFQPLYLDDHGTLRFKPNKIINYLFETRKLDLNAIASMPFPVEDREQIAQMLGYSHSGFGDLSYVTNETWYASRNASKFDSSLQARYNAVCNELAELKKTIKQHRDDFDNLLAHDED